MSKKCNCESCVNRDLYRWATIKECKCACHVNTDITGHDRLCCEFPNGLIKNNPYSELKPAKEYKKILDKLEFE